MGKQAISVRFYMRSQYVIHHTGTFPDAKAYQVFSFEALEDRWPALSGKVLHFFRDCNSLLESMELSLNQGLVRRSMDFRQRLPCLLNLVVLLQEEEWGLRKERITKYQGSYRQLSACRPQN